MVNVLLKKIKDLENELEKIKEKNLYAKEEIFQLFKQCKVEKEKKEQFKKRLLKTISALDVKNMDFFYDKNNALKYKSFIEIVNNFNHGFLVILDASMESEKQNFILGFLINKISPFFTLANDKIIGLLDSNQLKELKKLVKIPYYNPQNGEFNEIEIFKVIFDAEKFNIETIERAKQLFDEFRKRPSFKNKHFIEYSLIKNKVVDFEQEELNKQKEKFAYVFDEKYPNLEVMLKREIKNIPFVLALLERIDTEIDKLKNSKGLLNIVNRMLNYIELNIPDESMLEEIKFLRNRLSSEKK